jgi:hypothetical protein
MTMFSGKKKTVVALLAAAAAIATGTLASAASAEPGVPFNGSYSGTSSRSGNTVNIATTGQATHLGESSEAITTTVAFSATSCGMVAGSGTATAANGDDLFFSTSGTICPEGGGLFVVSVSRTITGGTGRFADASGTLAVSGTANLVAGTLSYTVEGSISY